MNEFSNLDSLVSISRKNQDYLTGSVDNNGDKTVEMAWNIISELKSQVPGIRGGFGIGFPFHSRGSDGLLVSNPEFIKCSDRFIDKVEVAKSLGHTAWICSSCQPVTQHHRDVCKECEQSPVKPRDILKIMPDIDLFIIADDISADVLDRIQSVSKLNGFHQSDHDVLETLQRVDRTFDGLTNGTVDSYFPADMHVISTNSFLEAMEQLGKGEFNPSVEIMSMYHSWMQNTEICFWFDFVFSGTFDSSVCDPEILEKVDLARRRIVEQIPPHDILEIAASKSKHARVLLEHEPTRDIFIERVESWKLAQ